MGQQLGVGGFGRIYRIRERSSGESFAMKVMNKATFGTQIHGQPIEAEIEAMQQITKSSPKFVLSLYDVTENQGHLYFRLELASCDLLKFVNGQPHHRFASSREAAKWTLQLCHGLNEIHRVGYLHRDIKADNLLLDGQRQSLRIADFGWGANMKDDPTAVAGTFQYMAPEILGRQGVQTEAVDVWSAGVTMLQLCTGKMLLQTNVGPGATGLSVINPDQANHVRLMRLHAEVLQTCPPAESQRPHHISPVCWDFFARMLVPAVSHRASIRKCLKHSWLQELQLPGKQAISAVASPVRNAAHRAATRGISAAACADKPCEESNTLFDYDPDAASAEPIASGQNGQRRFVPFTVDL